MRTQNWIHLMGNQFATRKLRRVLAVTVMLSSIGIATPMANAQTQLLSINRDGTNSSNGHSGALVFSADGRFVVFSSTSSDLVSGDTNNEQDVFVRDLQNGTTTMVSVNRDGTNGGNGIPTGGPVLSADGRFVAFSNTSSDLVNSDTNNKSDVFVRDLQNRTTTMVSVNRDGTNGGNNHSIYPVLSANGRFVAFTSSASDLVNNDMNSTSDVFVRDLQNGTTTMVSVNRDGTNGGNNNSIYPVLSANGRFVAFESLASDLVSNDTNGQRDIFVRDLQTGTMILASVNRNGTNGGNDYAGGPELSANGRLVAFHSFASDLVSNDTNGKPDVFVRDLQTGTTAMVSVNRDGTNGGNNNSNSRSLFSADGRFVAFSSHANDLVSNKISNKLDVFVRDLQNGTTTLVSVNRDGTNGGDLSCFRFEISADGRFVIFSSEAGDLVNNDTNGRPDVFVRDLQNGTTTIISVNRDGTNGGNGEFSDYPAISANGRIVGFESDASDLVSIDTNGRTHVFVRELNQPPMADAGADQTVITATSSAQITLNGSGSSDPDNDPLTYTWRENSNVIAGPNSSATSQVTLSVGSHNIELTVDDGRGGTDTDVVTITVKSAVNAIDDLIATVNSLNLRNKGLKTSLTTKLSNAKASLQDGYYQTAIDLLNDFINEVKAQRGKALTVAEADALIAQAQAIITAINGVSAPKIASESTEIAPLPTSYALEQNFPNPFNPSTKIQFSVLEAGAVQLSVYNINGQEVRTLVSGQMDAGHHTINWDGKDNAGKVMPSGVYLYKLRVNGFVQTRKMTFMK